MNINLIYHNSSFNFDLKKDVSIQYIEDLAAKLINKDKSFFNLLYEDTILSETPNSLLRDIVKSNDDISIIISPKKSLGLPKNKNILPKLKSCNYSTINNTEISLANNNLLSNETELSASFSEKSIKALQKLTKHNRTDRRKKKTDYISQNIVFEEVYDLKENELFSLLNNFSQKIKEYDNYLYRQYRNSFNKNKSKLMAYEKNVLELKDKQIKFIKSLINLLENKENNFLDELYKEIKQYNNKDIIVSYRNKNNQLESELSSSFPIKEKKSNSNQDLPLLLNKNNNNTIKKRLYLSQKRQPSINDKERRLKAMMDDENDNKISIIPKRNQENPFNNINLQEYNNNTINNIKSIKNNNQNSLNKNSTTNTITNANTNQSENSTFSKAQEKAAVINETHTPKKKSKDNINYYENGNNDNNKKKKKKTKDNKKEISYEDPSVSYKRVNTIENIKYDKNKVSTLFEISESYINENKDSDMSSDSSEDNNSENKDNNEMDHNKRKNTSKNVLYNYFEDIKNIKINLNKKKKSINDSDIRNSKIGYLVKAKNKKKKVGNNINDFLI
jgi:hypothetical protein